MNRYSLWKYIVIAVALVVGILFTLPNFFPEVPAVQVSAPKGKVDTALLGAVEDALKAANIPSATTTASRSTCCRRHLSG
jgi:preprotein translocase subunit SecD